MSDALRETTVERTRHGPFERIVLMRPAAYAVGDMPPIAQLSVYRAGRWLIDSGGTRFAEALVEALRATPIEGVILTHQHEDHAGGLAALRRAFGAIPIFAPRGHLAIIERAAPVPRYRADYWGHPEPVGELQPFDPGARFELGPVTVEAIETPGHTVDHVTFLGETTGEVWAVSGDLYLSKRPCPIYYEAAIDALLTSYRRLATIGPALRLLPTHGKTREDGARTLSESADWIAREVEAIHAIAAELATRDPHAIAAARYGAEDLMGDLTRGEISRAAFVRGVIDPVRTLPAAPIAPLTTDDPNPLLTEPPGGYL